MTDASDMEGIDMGLEEGDKVTVTMRTSVDTRSVQATVRNIGEGTVLVEMNVPGGALFRIHASDARASLLSPNFGDEVMSDDFGKPGSVRVKRGW